MPALTCALGPDSAGTVLERLLRGARHSIDAAIYEVGPSYRWALVRAAQDGVRVRVVLDAHASDGNAATARALIAAGARCRVSGMRPGTAHGKLLVVDRTVAVGTGNLIWRDAPRDEHSRYPPAAAPLAGTREWWVAAVGSRSLHHAASEAFEAHWRTAGSPPARWPRAPESTAPPVGTPMPQVAPLTCSVASRSLRLVTGPAAVASLLESMLATARGRVLVTVPYAHPGERAVRHLLDLMARGWDRGAGCALLLGSAPGREDSAGLARLPFPVRVMNPMRSTYGHAKGVIADRTVLVSSANWSAGGLGGNWEAALHIRHAAAASYYAAAWRRDWETATAMDV